MIDMAVKRVGDDEIEGLAIPYGVDLDGEQFTPKTDIHLDWFGKSGRPLLYDHGLDKPGAVKIGTQVDYEEREDGIWAKSQLERNRRYRKEVDGLIADGALGYSSGTMAHLAKKSGNRITQWPWVELSLTPIPAHPGTLNVHHYTKSASFLEFLDDDESTLTLAAVKAIAAGLSPETPGTENLDDKAGRVSAAVDELRDHARAAAEMRAKSGRVLSSANRERIRKALEAKPALLAAFDDLASLLSETDPEAAEKSSSEMRRQLLAFAAIEARALGVEVNA